MTHLPRAITPVPGGIGPIEMAVLAERLTTDQAAPGLPHSRYLHPDPTDPAAPVTSAARDVTRTLATAIPRAQPSLAELTRRWRARRASAAGQADVDLTTGEGLDARPQNHRRSLGHGPT